MFGLSWVELIFNKYTATLAVMAGLVFYGYHLEEKKVAERDHALDIAARAYTALQQEKNKVSVGIIHDIQKVIVTRQGQIVHDTKIIEADPVYRNECLTPDGVRAANEALAAPKVPAGTTGQVPQPVPAQ